MTETSEISQAWVYEHDEPQLGTPERTSAERDEFEATELRRLRLQYSRASSYQPPASTLTSKPIGIVGKVKCSVWKFWRHQISITVEHKYGNFSLGVFNF
jgi:hypothetical protein